MNSSEIYLLSGLVLSGLVIAIISTWIIFTRARNNATQLLEETQRAHDKCYGEATLMISNLEGQIITLQKSHNKLSTEKSAALQQYHTTVTLLDIANKKNIELRQTQEIQSKKNDEEINKKQKDISKCNNTIRDLELQLNQVVGHYQAEMQRNLLAEHAHISESLAKLTHIENKLVAIGTDHNDF